MAIPMDPIEQLRAEKAQLIKADKDIEDGWRRLRQQQQLHSDLETAGHDSRQAARLVRLLEQTLIEWERHRTLIVERIAYLEQHP